MDTWLFWNRGVDLAQAPVRFAEAEHATRLLDLRKQCSWPKAIERINEKAQKGLSVSEALQGSFGPTNELSNLEKKLRTACLDWIQNGQLTAYGFSCPRHADEKPQIVPKDLWSGYINWENSSLKANALKMEGVRLLLPAWEKQILAEEVECSNTLPVGRPSRESHIVKAFDCLHDAGK